MMKPIKNKLLNSASDLLRKFRDATQGVAAVEFALLSPLLLLIYIGTVEYSFAISLDRKLSRSASAIADLITQSDQYADENDLFRLMTISNEIMAPYSDRIPCMVLTGVQITGTSVEVEWSYDNVELEPENDGDAVPPDTRPDALKIAAKENCSDETPAAGELAQRARAVDSLVTIPNTIVRDGDFLVIAEVSYNHFPISFFPTIKRNQPTDALGRFQEDASTPSLKLGDVIYLRPRVGDRVCVASTCDD